MTNLSRTQKDFLNHEFGLSDEQIEEISKDEWHDIREKCYDIILDEMLDDEDNYNEAGDGSERCSLASSIRDISFKKLRAS